MFFPWALSSVWIITAPHTIYGSIPTHSCSALSVGLVMPRYLIAFGRGTRSCVGMQLAYADLYISLATFFRRFDCELFHTGRDAVDLYLDSFVPRLKPGAKGVRVKVQARGGTRLTGRS